MLLQVFLSVCAFCGLAVVVFVGIWKNLTPHQRFIIESNKTLRPAQLRRKFPLLGLSQAELRAALDYVRRSHRGWVSAGISSLDAPAPWDSDAIIAFLNSLDPVVLEACRSFYPQPVGFPCSAAGSRA